MGTNAVGRIMHKWLIKQTSAAVACSTPTDRTINVAMEGWEELLLFVFVLTFCDTVFYVSIIAV